MPVTVVILDDHAGFPSMARRILEQAGFGVVGEAATGQDALIAVATLRPKVLLLDVQLPDLDGLAVTQRLAELRADTVVV